MNKLLKISIIILVILGGTVQLFSIYLTSRTDVDSLSATELRAKVERLEEVNTDLESQVLTLASYNTVSSRAAELGYQDNKEFVSLYDPVEVARLR